MIETLYQVTTNYSVNDRATTPLNSIAKAALGLAAALGAALTVKTAWDQLVAGPQEIPTSVVTMASLINANQTFTDSAGKAVAATENFARSQVLSRTMIDQMVEASKTAAGGLQDFVGIGIDTINAFTQAGGQLGKPFVAFDKQVLTTAQLLGEDFKQAGMDAMRILTGGAGMDVRLFAAIRPQVFALSKELSALPIDKATEKFNKMASSSRLDLFQKAMGKFATPDAVAAITGTLPAQLSTLEDNVVAVRNAFGGAFSDRALASLTRLNDWFERNGTAIEATARRWGAALAWAFDRGVQAVQFIGDHLNVIIPVVAALAGASAVAFGKWLFALGPVKGAVTAILSPLKGVWTYIKGGVEAFAMFRTMGAGLGRSLWGALTLGISPISIALVGMGLFLGYVAASPARIQMMADAFAPVVAAINITWQALQQTGAYIETGLTPVMNAMGLMGESAFGWITQGIQFTSLAVLSLIVGFQKLGADAAGVAMKITSAFQMVRDTVSDVLTALSTRSTIDIITNPGKVIDTIKGAAIGQVEKYRTRNAGIDAAVADQKAGIDAGLQAALDKSFAGGKGRGKGGTSAGGRTAPVAQNHTTNIHGGVKIIQEFKENAEPDRVAFSVKDVFQKLAANPTQVKGGARLGIT